MCSSTLPYRLAFKPVKFFFFSLLLSAAYSHPRLSISLRSSSSLHLQLINVFFSFFLDSLSSCLPLQCYFHPQEVLLSVFSLFHVPALLISSHQSGPVEGHLPFSSPPLHPPSLAILPHTSPPSLHPSHTFSPLHRRRAAGDRRACHRAPISLSFFSPSLHLSLPSPPRRSGLRSECPAICLCGSSAERSTLEMISGSVSQILGDYQCTQ